MKPKLHSFAKQGDWGLKYNDLLVFALLWQPRSLPFEWM